jgi:hypothetical protein
MIRRFALDLVGGPNHPNPLLRRRRFWFLVACWLFAASPLVAGLAGLAGTRSSTTTPTRVLSPTTNAIDPLGPRATDDRFGVARSDGPVVVDLRPDLPTDSPPETELVPEALTTFPPSEPTTTAAPGGVDPSAGAQETETTLQFHPYTTVLGGD